VEPIIIFLWVYHRGGACSRHCYFPSGSLSCRILIRSTLACLNGALLPNNISFLGFYSFSWFSFLLLATLIEKPQLEFMNDSAAGAHAIRQIKLDFMTAHRSNGIQLVLGPHPAPLLARSMAHHFLFHRFPKWPVNRRRNSVAHQKQRINRYRLLRR